MTNAAAELENGQTTPPSEKPVELHPDLSSAGVIAYQPDTLSNDVANAHPDSIVKVEGPAIPAPQIPSEATDITKDLQPNTEARPDDTGRYVSMAQTLSRVKNSEAPKIQKKSLLSRLFGGKKNAA